MSDKLEITEPKSYPPIFVYDTSNHPKNVFRLTTNLSAETDQFWREAQTQSKTASSVQSSKSFAYDTISNATLLAGFSFGRYVGPLFRPYPADALIAFAVVSKFNKWHVTRLYPHWSAAADFVDRTSLPPGSTLGNAIRELQTQYASARINFVYTGFAPGIVPHEDFFKLYNTRSSETDVGDDIPKRVIFKTKSKPPTSMKRTDTLTECFKAIGQEIPGYEHNPTLSTVKDFVVHACQYAPGFCVWHNQGKPNQIIPDYYHYKIEEDDFKIYWGKSL